MPGMIGRFRSLAMTRRPVAGQAALLSRAARHYNRTLRALTAIFARPRIVRACRLAACAIAIVGVAVATGAGALACIAAAHAAELPDGLVADGQARVVEIVDGDTVVLDDGSEVRLVGLQAPKLALGRPDFEDWPLADEARVALEEMLLDRDVTLAYGGRRIDRHGRRLAHLFLADGTWVQAAVLSDGMARVYSFSDNRAAVEELLELEIAARAAGHGIWADPWYAVRRIDGLEREIDSFQLVEGRVLDVARVKNRAYLNFGTDWKTDFTLVLDEDALRLFDDDGVAVETFEGRRIRVRGWLESFNGPMIEITHPEQIEVIQE
jgi:micrococcal nuclease